MDENSKSMDANRQHEHQALPSIGMAGRLAANPKKAEFIQVGNWPKRGFQKQSEKGQFVFILFLFMMTRYRREVSPSLKSRLGKFKSPMIIEETELRRTTLSDLNRTSLPDVMWPKHRLRAAGATMRHVDRVWSD
jgi:hypothetical protein